jgi:hypothetical protein
MVLGVIPLVSVIGKSEAAYFAMINEQGRRRG